MLLLVTAAACLVCLSPMGEVHAQFNRDKPSEIGLVIMPFSVQYEEDRSITFLLEDYLRTKLPGRIGHPVFVSADVQPAIPMGKAGCLEDRTCVELLGGQFNASLVADVKMSRTGSEIFLEVDWFTTGNGLRIGRESVAFETGDEDSMVAAFVSWYRLYYDTSLRLNADNRANEGFVVGEPTSEQRSRIDSYREGREKSLSSRKQDFGAGRDDETTFDRGDPTADLRSLVTDDDDYYGDGDKARPPRERKRRKQENDSYSIDDELYDLPAKKSSARRPPKSTRSPAPKRSTNSYDSDDIDLDAEETRGTSVASYTQAQRAGIGAREYKRFARSGLTIARFKDRRWAYGGRFHVRAGAYYGFGYLTRRYATLIYIDLGARKTDEYMWESLGASAANPGGGFGIGYAPIDLLDIEFELSFMYAKQDLRREWKSRDIGESGPQGPEGRPTAHVLTDLRVRFFLKPEWRVKITPGVGVTLFFMSGYDIDPEPPLEYSNRPLATVVGLTPLIGINASLSPYVSLYVDVLPTIYLSQSSARFEDHVLFGGATEENLAESDKEPPLFDCPSSCAFMGRVAVGTMFLF
ncbi:MAG: hypothetical protein CL928_19110 [Deltaproteobacteria bacterium]|nr:hypothetical protein [Deltaproteobacteria bacterium]